MTRNGARRLVLVLTGLACVAGSYPLLPSLFAPTAISPGDQMILGIFIPIGVFLLLAARNPAANRSLILCVAWANLAHAAVMMIQGIRHPGEAPSGPVGLAIMASISVALIVLAPAQPASRPAAAEASVPAVSRN